MFNVLSDLNWLAIIISTAVLTVLGGIYFGALVARQYAVALGNDPNQKQEMKPIAIIGPMIANLATIITTAILMYALSVESLSDALTLAAIVGLGYLVAMTVNIAINPNFPRPFYYAALNGPYFFAGSLITGAILFAFK